MPAPPGRGTTPDRRPAGRRIIVGLPALNALAWLLFPPDDPDGRPAFDRQVVGEFIGSTAVLLLAAALVLSTRARWLEPWFGGLDKMYRAHRDAAVVGFMLLVVHAALTPWRLSSEGGVPAGLLAIAGLTVMVALSIGPRLPVLRRVFAIGYGRWRLTHRFIGLFFVMGLAHMLLVDAVVHTTAPPFGLLMAAYVVGTASFAYSLLLAPLVRRKRRYVVETVRRLNASTVEVGLRPRREGRALPYRAGQFAFVRFRRRGLREPHPFTVSSAPHESLLRLTIKATGDFTRRLHERIEPGVGALVEGSYGMLDYRRGRTDQIWVAGGIGVTPFLSWCRDLTDDGTVHDVDFFYVVRKAEDAVFWDEIDATSRRHPRLRAHLHISSEAGTLTAARIAARTRADPADADVYLCGPVPMIHALERGLQGAGVPSRSIHFEEFSFR